MGFLFLRLRRFGDRGRVAGLPDVGAHREPIGVFIILERLELSAELKLVRRGQMGEPEADAIHGGGTNDLAFDRHRAVMLELDRERAGLPDGGPFGVRLEETSSDAEVDELIEARGGLGLPVSVEQDPDPGVLSAFGTHGGLLVRE